MKKGDTWISAVLYIGLGILVVSMLMAAGIPVVDRLRDRNVILQTKEVMLGVNEAIRTVVREGPGSQRSVIIDIGKGDFEIDENSESIKWGLETKAVLSEPDIVIREGDLMFTTKSTKKKGEFLHEIKLEYNGIADIVLNGDAKLIGRHNLIIKNTGINAGLPTVEIREI